MACNKFDPCDCGDCEFARTHKEGIWAGTAKCENCREEKDKHSFQAIMGKEPNPDCKPKNQLPVIYRALRASTVPDARDRMAEWGFTPFEIPCNGCGEGVLVDKGAFEHAGEMAKTISEKPMLVYCHVCVNEMYTPQSPVKGLA